jgi:hypothetical protein
VAKMAQRAVAEYVHRSSYPLYTLRLAINGLPGTPTDKEEEPLQWRVDRRNTLFPPTAGLGNSTMYYCEQ